MARAQTAAVNAAFWVIDAADSVADRLPGYGAAKGRILDRVLGPEEPDEYVPRTIFHN